MVDVEWLANSLRGRDAKGIVVETARLVRNGDLPVGSRLPPLRDLAFHLGISPATISGAWTELRRQKVITGRGRNGTWVTEDAIGKAPARTGRLGNYGPDALDLSLAVPDPQLLPDLRQALGHAVTGPDLNSYRRSRIEPRLRDAIEPTWAYPPPALLATNGGYNAVYAAVHALVTPGDTVACEEPTAIRLLDILEDAGAHVIAVARDDEGPIPADLARAMAHRPVLFLYQPRTHSVTGRHVTEARMASLGDVLDRTETLVLEDDGLGDLSAHPSRSLGSRFPDRVIHVRSLSKSYGPDLRLAILSAPEEIVERVQSYRLFSAGWTSRLLQNAAAWLLGEQATREGIDKARVVYRARRTALLDALDAQGIAAYRGDGLCIWLPVPSEPFALVTLAARGIAVLPGAQCFLRRQGFIRVGTSLLKDGYGHVAQAIALASRP